MSKPLRKRVLAQEGADFAQQLGAFALGSFVEKGIGAVIIHLGQSPNRRDGKVEADLLYASCRYEPDMLPPAAVEMVKTYEPDTEVVVAFVGKDGKATCLTLAAKDCLSPLDAYTMMREGQVDIDPGSAIRLKEPIGDIQPGIFVFLRQEKALMKLAQARMEEPEGEIVATDDEVSVHMDYRDYFELVPMGPCREEGGWNEHLN